MLLNRAKKLAIEYGKLLKEGEDCQINLYQDPDNTGLWEFEDSLHSKQIDELKEDDFVEYYLK